MSDEINPDIERYLQTAGYQPDDLIAVAWKHAMGSLGHRVVTVADAPALIHAHRAQDCWINANPIQQPADERSRGTVKDVTAVRALWADLDVGEGKLASYAVCREVISEISALIGAEPSVIIASGHGLQPRWVLDGGGYLAQTNSAILQVIERFGRLVQLVASRHGGKADNVYDLARILRAPGTTNLKIDGKPVPVRIKFTEESPIVDRLQLEVTLEEYVPDAPPATPEENRVIVDAADVTYSRGNAYVKGAIEKTREEMKAIASWPEGFRDERDRGWEKVQADAAYRLAALAKAEWNQLTLERAQELFVDMAPVDSGWTVRDVIKKWQSQVGRAPAADPPLTVTDDPLSPGYIADSNFRQGDASPHRGAADGVHAAGGQGDNEALGSGADSTDVPISDGGAGVPAVASWRKYAWTDRGNADRVIDLFGAELRWCPPLKSWLRYERGAWRVDDTGGETAVQQMVERLPMLEARLYPDVDVVVGRKVTNQRADFMKWATEQEAAAKETAAAKSLQRTKRLNAAPEEFDAEPMLLNTVNGIIDLATGELLPHEPSLMLRRQIRVPYDPDAKAPMWEAFLEHAMPTPDMRDYLQRIVGYTITGMTTEQVLFFHVGPPQTGKSLLYEVLMAMMGEFGRVVPPTMLLVRKQEQHPAELMEMEGGRVLALDETPEGARIDEALMKRLSGESTITARGMGENWRKFRIVGKVHLMTNHDPHITDDPAVHRRLHYVPWNYPVPPEKRVRGLKDMIIAQELQGVLAWAVRGAQRWQEDGLSRPVEAELAREAYIASEDEFGQFLEEEVIIGASNSFTPTTDIRQRHAEWCRARGAGDGMSVHAITKRLKARGMEQVRTNRARGFPIALQAPRWARDPLS